MGLLDLHWKGKSKANPSSTNNGITSIFSRPQPPPPSAPRWVRTPHWNEAESSASNSTFSTPYRESAHAIRSRKVKASQEHHGDEKVVPGSLICEHKISCDLSTSGCCACLDRRPMKRDYFIYKDGRGLVAEGTRWGNYCPGCKGSFNVSFRYYKISLRFIVSFPKRTCI